MEIQKLREQRNVIERIAAYQQEEVEEQAEDLRHLKEDLLAEDKDLRSREKLIVVHKSEHAAAVRDLKEARFQLKALEDELYEENLKHTETYRKQLGQMETERTELHSARLELAQAREESKLLSEQLHALFERLGRH